ncbi:MAG: class I SAM-dependent methyltransferase [Chitinophagaceae bacterium]|nr:class I SAM-dependent methyltransferase [Chitinophagaceae bacterium]
MEENTNKNEPNNTAIRVALWRALHKMVDALPFIIDDEIGLQLAAPDTGWQQRPDMHPDFTRRLRASIVARSRFVEDEMDALYRQGIYQYVLLGAGLDTYPQRRAVSVPQLQVFEIDEPATQSWKKQRLTELGFGLPDWLHFVPVNFETEASWLERLIDAGFDMNRPAFIACTGVTLYLTKEAIADTLQKIATFAPGSKLAITFYLPITLLDEEDKPLQLIAEKGAMAAGTPFLSFFTPEEVLALASKAGIKDAKIISTGMITERYFSNRTDHFKPATGEMFLTATI